MYAFCSAPRTLEPLELDRPDVFLVRAILTVCLEAPLALLLLLALLMITKR